MKVGDLVRPKGNYPSPRVGIVLERTGSGRNGHAIVLFSDAGTLPNPCRMPIVWLEVLKNCDNRATHPVSVV